MTEQRHVQGPMTTQQLPSCTATISIAQQLSALRTATISIAHSNSQVAQQLPTLHTATPKLHSNSQVAHRQYNTYIVCNGQAKYTTKKLYPSYPPVPGPRLQRARTALLVAIRWSGPIKEYCLFTIDKFSWLGQSRSEQNRQGGVRHPEE